VSVEDDVRLRDNSQCFRCGKAGYPMECHHRLLKKHGGPDSADNRLMLCGRGNLAGRWDDGTEWCHGWGDHNGKAARAAGWLISQFSRTPPGQIPARHWDKGLVLLTSDGGVIAEAEQAAEKGDSDG